MSIAGDVWNFIKDTRDWKAMQLATQKIPELERRIAALEGKLGNPVHGRVCDHCGSPDIKRTGSRPDPTFHMLGTKQAIYQCNACNKESAFTD